MALRTEAWSIPLIVARLVKDRDCYSSAAIGYMHPAALKASDKEVTILEPLRPVGLTYKDALDECVAAATTWLECGMAEAVVVVYIDKVAEGESKKAKVIGYLVPTSDKTSKKTSAKKIVKSFYQFREFPP